MTGALPTYNDIIAALVKRQFPTRVVASALAKLLDKGHPEKRDYDRQVADANAYEAELRGKPRNFVMALYLDATSKLPSDEATDEEKDRQKFFNQPQAKADFDYWTKAAHWTLDEAVALAFGKAPEVVSWQTLSLYAKVSPFAQKYGRVRELTLRAKQWQQLYDPALPGFFLAWAKRTGVSYPPELEERLTARGTIVADWKSARDTVKSNFDHYRREAEEHSAAQKATIEELQANLATLQARLTEAPPIPEQGAEKSAVAGKERDSVLKLIVGMAVKGYAYDPNALRSSAPGEIAGDLAELGLSIDPDTVRKWLKEGAGLLPPGALPAPDR